ncbi:hypothetical protein [Neobacillus terrae]|uniref:hypothetical protein n=1 Tax=Neobacillus terrae TaxID=3034837 RepID=UPI001409093D|nr:hypothetical protein [Neobacillus terrae]NHM30477.1 hypothetical protein [Neobacillus terrae]
MLVEINLLPRKESRNSAFILAVSILASFFLIAACLFFWKVYTIDQQASQISRETAHTEQITTKQQESVSAIVSSNSIKKLETSADWVKKYPIKTVPVMRGLTAMLPERGFIQNFAYDEAGTFSLTIQFDTSQEAAFYLARLNGAEWIKDASLKSLSAQDSSSQKPAGSAVADTLNDTEKESYMPRYFGVYEIKLDEEAAKKNDDSKWYGTTVSEGETSK